jgi:hypothetical protein
MLPTKDDLKKRYATFSDDRLLEILYNKNEYTADAVEVAQTEIASRNITDAQVKTFVSDRVEALEVQAVEKKILSWVPLELWEKLFFFFIWFSPFFLGSALRTNYAEDGLILKLRQSKLFAIAGFTSVILTFIISELFSLSQTSGYVVYFLLPVLFFIIEKQIKYDVTE